MLFPAAHLALIEAERMLHRSSADGTLPVRRAALHSRFLARRPVVIVATRGPVVLVILASGGRGDLAVASVWHGDRGVPSC